MKVNARKHRKDELINTAISMLYTHGTGTDLKAISELIDEVYAEDEELDIPQPIKTEVREVDDFHYKEQVKSLRNQNLATVALIASIVATILVLATAIRGLL